MRWAWCGRGPMKTEGGATSPPPRRSPALRAGATTVIGLFDRLSRPFLRALDPEDAHGLTIRMLKIAPLPPRVSDDRRLASRVFGLNFKNHIGIVGGFAQ